MSSVTTLQSHQELDADAESGRILPPTECGEARQPQHSSADPTPSILREEEDFDARDNLPLLQKDSLDGTSFPTKPDQETATNSDTNRNQLIGMLYVVLSSLSFSVCSVSIKHSIKSLEWPVMVFYYMAVTCAVTGVRVKAHKPVISLHVAPRDRGFLAIRSIAGYAVICFNCYAMTQMVLTEATVILFTNPVLTLLLGACLLSEPFDKIDLVCSLLAYVGVVFVARPPFWFPVVEGSAANRPTASGVICALLGAGCISVVYIAMRKIKHLHPLVTVHYFQLSSVVLAFFTVLVRGLSFKFPLETRTVVGILVTGISSNLGQTFLTIGFQRVNAGLASIMRYFDVVFVFAMDQLLLGEHVSGYSVFGGSLVAMSAISVALRRLVKAKKVIGTAQQ